jgi:hypothetical protein
MSSPAIHDVHSQATAARNSAKSHAPEKRLMTAIRPTDRTAMTGTDRGCHSSWVHIQTPAVMAASIRHSKITISTAIEP